LKKTGNFREITFLQVRVLLPLHPIYQAIFLPQAYERLIFRPAPACQLGFWGASGRMRIAACFVRKRLFTISVIMMASQKLTNCCVAAIALVTAAYLSTPHSSTIAALHLALFA
jgi:hypothetical protein